MNKNCEKKQQHIVKIVYMWKLCITLKKKEIQNGLCRIGIRQSHLRQNGHYVL